MSVKRWIKGRNGKPLQIDAELCGIKGIFLNKDPEKPNLGWCITHRASGLRVGTYYFKTKAIAAKVAQKLTNDHGVNWSIKDPQELVAAHHGINSWMRKVIGEVCKEKDFKEVRYSG